MDQITQYERLVARVQCSDGDFGWVLLPDCGDVQTDGKVFGNALTVLTKLR